MAPLSIWGVYITAAYSIFSINANNYQDGDSLINTKALAILFGPMALIVDSIVTLISWTAVLPMFWRKYGWGTPELVFFQVYNIFIHLTPIFCATVSFLFLQDAPAYLSNSWSIIFVTVAYVSVNYYMYDEFGIIVYNFMNWRDPDNL